MESIDRFQKNLLFNSLVYHCLLICKHDMSVIYVFLLLISLRNVMCVQRSWGSFVKFVPTCFLSSDTIRNGIYTDNSVVWLVDEKAEDWR